MRFRTSAVYHSEHVQEPNNIIPRHVVWNIGVARGGQRGHAPPKNLENIVILWFERRFSKQNSVIRLISKILPPKKILGRLHRWFGISIRWEGAVGCKQFGSFFATIG